VAGNRQLYEYCATHGVPCSRLGKLLVAPGRHQADALDALAAKAVANGVGDLQPLTPGQVAKLEPHVRAQGGGFLSPSSGVLDVQRLMASFAADAVPTGRATLLKNAPVVAGELHHASWRLNCEDASLRFGPDVAFVDKLTYDGVDVDALVPAFTAAIRDYFPALPSGALKYAYAGVRPKLAGPGQPAADFRLMNHAGVPGLLALYGIESPGLTACMALADAVVARLQTS